MKISKNTDADISKIVWSAKNQNDKDLCGKLCLLQYGQYFVDSFVEHAQTYNVNLPDKDFFFLCLYLLT